jgi:3'-phosphoadenosine 5'-phosphosulfate sulfotransferase (PAPS reductase)/FAD synthetase
MKFEKEQTYLMHSRTELFKEKVSTTKRIIKTALKQFEKHYIAFSGGKDSTALLDLVLNQDQEITVVHWDFGPYYMPRDIYDHIIENAKEIGTKDLRTPTSKKYEKLKRKAINVLGQDFLGKYIPKMVEEGYDLAFIGLRARESCKRRAKLNNYIKHDGTMFNCYPIRDWSYKDVWAYIVKHELPYLNEFYDRYGEILGDKHTRFCTFFDPEFDKFGASNIDGHLMYKHRNDDVEV